MIRYELDHMGIIGRGQSIKWTGVMSPNRRAREIPSWGDLKAIVIVDPVKEQMDDVLRESETFIRRKSGRMKPWECPSCGGEMQGAHRLDEVALEEGMSPQMVAAVRGRLKRSISKAHDRGIPMGYAVTVEDNGSTRLSWEWVVRPRTAPKA